MTTITLPLDDFVKLLFGDLPLSCPSIPKSRIVTPDYNPVIVPLPIGLLLRELDPDETKVKVFDFPTHAEVWRIAEWRDSTTYRILLKREQAKANEESLARQEAEAKRLSLRKAMYRYVTKVLKIEPSNQMFNSIVNNLVTFALMLKSGLQINVDLPQFKEYLDLHDDI